MDSSNKKQQQSHHARAPKSSASGETIRKSVDLNSNNKRNSRRREQPPTPRNDQQQLNTKQQQHQSAKQRPNVDKRPRARGSTYGQNYGSNEGSARTGDRSLYEGSGLAAASSNYLRSGFEHEQNSVYAQGSKKQNLNHLLNFHCVPRQVDYASGYGIRHGHGNAGRKTRFNKEQFLQANFQFVIRAGAKAQVNGSPDTLIDWSFIEQINIQTTEEPQCPICLYPPVAAKLTRCGHAYCWPCLLHYLSLSDKTWRKCPICYDAIHAIDLKSCTIEQQCNMNVGDRITFQLMRRRKGSMYIERYQDGILVPHEHFPLLSSLDESKRYSKFLIAKRADIAFIIERERVELMAESDSNCPEDVFIQQALVTLKDRRDKLGLSELKEEDELVEEFDVKEVMEERNVEDVLIEPTTPPALELSVEEKTTETEKDDAASVSSGEASIVLGTAGSGNNNKFYYFYQSNDGQNIYLHPLNVKMLQACYGSLEQAPLLIEARILQREQHSMDEDHRRKFTCLGHLPLTCQFAVVEVELQVPDVSAGILKLFKDDLLHRKKDRERREREERKREQHINEINDRQMGKLIASAANLNLSSAHEFPTCGFEEVLPSPTGVRQPMSIPNGSGTRYANVTATSPKVELWPTIGSSSPLASSGSLNSPSEFKVGAWGRAAPTLPAASVVVNRTVVDMDNEHHAQGHWALGDLLAGALDKQKQRGGKPTAPTKMANVEEGKNNNSNKKQKKSKKMAPLFAVGMNRAP